MKATEQCQNRLEAVGAEPSPEILVEPTEQMIFATPEFRHESAISGVILFDETIRRTLDDGTPIPAEYLASRGIHPGIKVDTGAKGPLANHSGEKVTEKDWMDYVKGAWSTSLWVLICKWRASNPNWEMGCPVRPIFPQMHMLLLDMPQSVRKQGLVPIREPEVWMDGSHDSQTFVEINCKNPRCYLCRV